MVIEVPRTPIVIIMFLFPILGVNLQLRAAVAGSFLPRWRADVVAWKAVDPVANVHQRLVKRCKSRDEGEILKKASSSTPSGVEMQLLHHVNIAGARPSSGRE